MNSSIKTASKMGAKDQAVNKMSKQDLGQVGKMFRKPQRVSVTIPESVYAYLIERSNTEGRSLSNLASHLLEVSARQE